MSVLLLKLWEAFRQSQGDAPFEKTDLELFAVDSYLNVAGDAMIYIMPDGERIAVPIPSAARHHECAE